MSFLAVAVGASVVIGVGGQIMQANAQDDAADAQNAYNLANYQNEEKYAEDLEAYNQQVYTQQIKDRDKLTDWDVSVYKDNVQYRDNLTTYDNLVSSIKNQYNDALKVYDTAVYASQVGYRNDLIANQTQNIKRQDDSTKAAETAIKSDYINQLATLGERAAQETVSAQYQMQDIGQQATKEAATAKATAGEHGVAGNSVQGIINDVFRQEGEGYTIVRQNLSNTAQQINLQAKGAEAQADTAINQIPIQNFAPIAPVDAPAPRAPVDPTQPRPQVQLPAPRPVINPPAPVKHPTQPGNVQGSNGLATALGALGTVANGATSYLKLGGKI